MISNLRNCFYCLCNHHNVQSNIIKSETEKNQVHQSAYTTRFMSQQNWFEKQFVNQTIKPGQLGNGLSIR